MDREQFALKLSVWAAIFFAALGIGFGVLTRSDAIMLDGFFSLIGFVVGGATLKVSRLVGRPADDKFHFGYAWFEPLMNTGKGLLFLGVTAVALVSAVDALLHGGRTIVVGWAVLYALIATTGCVAMAVSMRRFAQNTRSPLVEVDARSWVIDTATSAAVFLALVAAFFMEGTRLQPFMPYVDPLLVMILVVVVLPLPITTVRDGLKELVKVAPDDATQQEVRRRFQEATRSDAFPNTYLRMIRVGRHFYVMAHIVVARDFKVTSVQDLDTIRERVTAAIQAGDEQLIVDVFFTADERWAA